MVANNLFGSLNIFRIFFDFFSSSSDKSSRLEEVKEKNETSDPETKADKNIRIQTKRIPRINPAEISFSSIDTIVFNNKGRGSSFKI